MIKTIISTLYRPTPAPGIPSLLRRLCRGPRLFSLISVFMQIADLNRQNSINSFLASDDDYFKRVQIYNASVTQKKVITRTRRMENLFRILDIPGRDLSKERILHIGPRDVHELLMSWVFGFSWRNISAIDLYSTNPKIQIMNMESMRFDDDLFDAVIMAQTLAYAKSTETCLREIVRVLRPGGRAVFGATYTDSESEWAGNRVSGIEILSILKKLPLEIYFYQPEQKINALGNPQTSHVFGIVKKDPSQMSHDEVDLLGLIHFREADLVQSQTPP